MTTTTDPVCWTSTTDSPDPLYRRRDDRRALLLHETIDDGSATDDPGRIDGPRRSVDLAHAKAART